jgi:hypothetical protein
VAAPCAHVCVRGPVRKPLVHGRSTRSLGVMLDVLGGAIAIFSFHPLRCALIAAVFTLALLFRRYSRGTKFILGGVAIAWWAFAVLEATTPSHMNIRVDLVFLGPVFLLLAVVGVWCLAVGDRGRVKA